MNLSAESLALNISSFRAQMLSSLLASNSSDAGTPFGDIFAGVQSAGGASAATPAGSDSGYAMMTRINGLDVTYKAQYSELAGIEAALPQLAAAAQQLGAAPGAGADNAGIETQLQDFAQRYNAWVQRFAPDVQPGGVLAGTQAAEVSLYELEQSVRNPFIGVQDGWRGLSDIGIAIDPGTHRMSVDTAKLDAALAGNRQGVMDALADFGAGFAKSANLLAADGNFVRNRLDNLGGAISYIDGNTAAWRQEFGSGDAANPTGQIARALAAYNSAAGL